MLSSDQSLIKSIVIMSFFQNKLSDLLINQLLQLMTDRCYRIQYKAYLSKLTLALKMQCQISVIWKRGQKKCQSKRAKLVKGEAIFNEEITISCNMIFNTKLNKFQQKITKFTILLISEKGTKQAGQIQFDVAQFINLRLEKKDYQQKLVGCPDKNARLIFRLTGAIKQELSIDNISERSYINNDNSLLKESNSNCQTKRNDNKQMRNDKKKQLEQQNRKMMEQIKKIEELKQNNAKLRSKLKSQQFPKAKDKKDKIDKLKGEIEKMKAEIRTNKKIQAEVEEMEKNLLSCKVKIMRAFNLAAEAGGGELVDAIQASCGFQ